MQVVGLPVQFVSFRVSGIKRKATAKIFVDYGNEISFKKFSPNCPNWIGNNDVGWRLRGSWQTQVTVEVSTFRKDGVRIHETAKYEERYLELYDSDNFQMGVAYLRIAVDPSKLVKPEYSPGHPHWGVPTFKMLFDTITILESCQELDKFSRERPCRLAKIFLWSLWKYLEDMWSALLRVAVEQGVDPAEFRENAFEDTLHLIFEQVIFLAKVTEAMGKHPVMRRLKDGTHHLMLAVAKSASMLFQYGFLYTTATYATLQIVLREERTFHMIRLSHQEHIYLRTQVLADYYNDRTLFNSRVDLVKDLFARSLMEYRGGEEWKWASYTRVFGLLKYSDAYEAFARISDELKAQESCLDPTVRDFLRRLLMHTMLTSRRLPPNLILKDGIYLNHTSDKAPAKKDSAPVHVGHGSYSVVYRGAYQDPKTFGAELVAVKCLHLRGTEMNERSLYPEIVNCYTLNHPNVMRLRGINRDNGAFSLVFPWMENGRVVDYVQRITAKGELDLERISRKLMFQVAAALAYIHREGVVHGDLRGANILVDHRCNVRVSDFGLSVHANGHSRNYDSTRQGNEGWLAPELQRDAATGQPKRPTREGDMFSFGISCIEIYTGMDPWSKTKLPSEITSRHQAIVTGIRPDRPVSPQTNEKMDQMLWDLIVECWNQDPSRRPLAKEIVERLQSLMLCRYKPQTTISRSASPSILRPCSQLPDTHALQGQSLNTCAQNFF